jgi:hypothetical protein
MKTKEEICEKKKKLEEEYARGDSDYGYFHGFVNALDWVLNQK